MDSKQSVAFPIFVRLDDGEVIRIENIAWILHHLEAIDIENDEYLFWDAEGRGLKVLIEKDDVSGFRAVENGMTLHTAFAEYAKQLGVSLDATGTPDQIWGRVQKLKESVPKRRGLLARLFNRT